MMEWGDLPSIVLLEIYDYLSAQDRLLASSVCRHWRYSVFQVPLSQNLNLIWKSEEDTAKVQFLSQNFVHKVQNVKLVFDATSPQCLDLVGDTLAQLEGNRQLKTLRVRCTEESLSENVFRGSDITSMIMRNYFIRKVAVPLMKILNGKNCLESFSFPLIQELFQKETNFVPALAKTKSYSLRNIFLSTIHIDYAMTIPEIDFDSLSQLKNLQMLSLDHEMLTDHILSNLGKGSTSGGIKRFSLVAVKPNLLISYQGWQSFVENNSLCGVRLTVVGDNVEVDEGCSYLFSNIPLTHFRALYCKVLSFSILNSIAFWNENRLEYLELVHDHRDFSQFILQNEEFDEEDAIIVDPLIFASWKCRNLSTIKMGMLYCGHNLVGLARLRGPELLRLEIPRHKILYHDMNILKKEISEALERPWKPVSDRKFPSTESDTRRLVHTYRSMIADEY